MRIFLLLVVMLAPSLVGAAPPSQERWPAREWAVAEPSAAVDKARLDSILDAAVTDGETTRAVVVVEDGAIIAERYAPGYDAHTRFFSYSMAKSFVATFVGILAGEGRLDLGAPAPVPEWAAPDDPRRAIRLSDLLHMSSGLWSNEDYRDPASDTSTMLFGVGRDDVAHHAADRPLKYQPGRFFKYSNGTSNILSGIVGRALGGTEDGYRRFMHDALFGPLDMRSVVAGFDAKGNFVGSSLISATARDYARFGLLYQRDGRWRDRRILPEAWVRFARTPAPASNGLYGAHFWLGPSRASIARDPGVREAWPEDAFSARGLWGQIIAISPSRRLVLVILGNTQSLPQAEQDAHDRLAGELFSTVSAGAGE